MTDEVIVTDAPGVALPLLSRQTGTVLDIRDGGVRIDARRALVVAASSIGWRRSVTDLQLGSGCREVRLFVLEGLRPAPIELLFDHLESAGFSAVELGHGSHDRVGVLRVIFRRSPEAPDIDLVRQLAGVAGAWPRTLVVGPRVAVTSVPLLPWAPINAGTSLLNRAWKEDDSELRRASPDVLLVGPDAPAAPTYLASADALRAEGVPLLGVGALDPSWLTRCDLVHVDAVGALAPTWPTVGLPATPGAAADAVDRILSAVAGGTPRTASTDTQLLGEQVATALATAGTASGRQRLRATLLREFAPSSWWSRNLAPLGAGWKAHSRVLAVVGHGATAKELSAHLGRQSLVPQRTVMVAPTRGAVRRALESGPEEVAAFVHPGTEPAATYLEEAVLLLGLLGASAIVSPRRFLRIGDSVVDVGERSTGTVAGGSAVARVSDLQSLPTLPQGGIGFERRLVTSLSRAGGAVHRHGLGQVTERLLGERAGLRRALT